MIDFEINDKGILVWNDGSSRPATHQEQELTYEIAYRDDQIKALQAEVERLRSEPTRTVKEVLKQLKAQAETTSKENPPTDGRGGEFDAIWMTDLNGLIEEASWQFQEQAND